ncbi:hypothetical protein V6N12_076511 [Hibiscus sabdariffa]|uniref:Uncharacterized protein n=1 Tax=Hibiscus sabdariffa TaxID=183260 RepID=A0ABR2DAX8_9ROSI
MIDDEARRMHHGLDQDYEVMEDDDPDKGNLEPKMSDQGVMNRDEVVEVVNEKVASRDFIHAHQPHVVFLLETWISGVVADYAIREFGFCL